MAGRATALVGALLVACLAVSGCGAAAAAGPDSRVALRVGYLPNLTQSGAVVGTQQGLIADALGPGVDFSSEPFNAGPSIIEAFLTGEVDAAFVGPSPAVNAFVRSQGQALRIVSGATSGGAALVVRSGISTAADLRGRRIATPQLGNTQDVALRFWLRQNGLSTNAAGGGDVSVLPQSNGQTLQTFKSGQIDGAWLPEPWASLLVAQADAHVLVDESSLWPHGQFATTVLVVRTDYLSAHPDVVRRLLTGLLATDDWMSAHPVQAQQVAAAAITRLTGQKLPVSVVASAWAHLTFTLDPLTASLRSQAAHAAAMGLLDPDADLTGICDLTLLDEVLATAGRAKVAA
jgi:NitT/TauT family transport system substrate-binding protein